MPDNVLRNLRPLLKRAPAIANLLLVIGIGLTGARLFWLVWPVEAAELPPAPSSGGPNVERAEVDIDSIAATNLFGTPPSEGGTASDEVINAPETRLDLTLTGIVSSAQSDRSRALIKKGNGDQEPYAVGDSVGSNVKLHDIYATRVILDRGGRYETLTLERLKTEANAVQRVQRDTRNAGNRENLGATLSDVRNEILEKPSRITEYVRLQPEKRNGNLVGYRVFPGRDRTLFQRLGLRPGELVTQVNGTSLNDPQQAMQSLSNLAQASSVSVTLERGGEQRTMSVSFE